jgi:hypothetical protein
LIYYKNLEIKELMVEVLGKNSESKEPQYGFSYNAGKELMVL